MPDLADLVAEAQRQFSVCTACRYCEGYCAVFPAMERRTEFGIGDVIFLANICHDCRGCLQACMYTPPHELAVDIPLLLSSVRSESYKRYAWPPRLRWAFGHNLAMALALVLVGLSAVLLELLSTGHLAGLFVRNTGPGAFYALVPWLAMLIPGLAAGVYIFAVLALGLFGFWRETHGDLRPLARLGPWLGALADAASLRYLDGGGPGCYYPEAEAHTQTRRILHQLVVFGFVADFASTSLAAVYQDLFRQFPPFPLVHPVVLIGAGGGISLAIGCTGLIWLKLRSDPGQLARQMRSLDFVFLWVLNLVALSGLALLAVRETALMGSLLAFHLALLVALYFTFPYGKFVHGLYRLAALLKNRIELSGRADWSGNLPG